MGKKNLAGVSSEAGTTTDTPEREVGKETDGPPECNKQRRLLPGRRPRDDVDEVPQVVDGGREGEQMYGERWGRRSDKVDKAGHGHSTTNNHFSASVLTVLITTMQFEWLLLSSMYYSPMIERGRSGLGTHTTTNKSPLRQVCTTVIVPTLICAPPAWEKMGSPRRALDGKGKDEHHDLGSPIKSYSNPQLRYVT